MDKSELKGCSTCFFGAAKDVPLAPCWKCKYDPINMEMGVGAPKAWLKDHYVTDSDQFWKDPVKTPEEKQEPVMREKDPYEDVGPGMPWDTPMEEVYDSVEKPRHYMLFPEHDLEVRDVVNRLLMRMEACEGFDHTPVDYADYAQLMQYLMRWFDKGGLEDLKKARWYLDQLIGNWIEDETPNL
jgi:hypothetical protein